MTNVQYRATDDLPAGVPAAVIARRGEVLILVDRGATVDQLCEALTPLITAHANRPVAADAADRLALDRRDCVRQGA